MSVILVVIVSIVLVTAATLRRRRGASATSSDAMNRPQCLSGWMPRGLSCRVLAAWILLLTGLATGGLPSAQASRPLVYVVPIEGAIDLGLAPFLSRTIREAEQAGAAAVLLEINTFGGPHTGEKLALDRVVNGRYFIGRWRNCVQTSYAPRCTTMQGCSPQSSRTQ